VTTTTTPPDATDAFDLKRPSVFVSHSSLDKAAVWPIVEFLTAYAAVPWVDALEMRPGDQLFRRVSTAIEGSAYLLVMVSENSVKSKWVEEEVRQALSSEFYDNRIRVIPCLLDKTAMPAFLRDRLYCDFSRGLIEGGCDVLRGIHRDRHVISLPLDTAYPLQLDDAVLRREVGRCLTLTAGNQRFFFVVDAVRTLGELVNAWRAIPVKGDPMDPFVVGVNRVRSAAPLILPNLSCILSRVADVVVEYTGRDAGLLESLVSVIQRTVTMCLYWFWHHVRSASEPGTIDSLPTLNGGAVQSTLIAIDALADPNRIPARSIEAHVFGCAMDDLLDLGLQGRDGVFDSRVNVPKAAIPTDTRDKYLGTFPLSPDAEVFRHEWLRYFLPAVATVHVLECSFSGQHVGHYLSKIGLRKEQYKHLGFA